MLKILAPVDGSPSSNDAIEYLVRSLEKRGPAEIHVLHVQPPLHEKIAGLAQPAVLERFRAEAAREATETAERLLARAGIRHTVTVETGEPSEMIARYAKAQQCDEIVMGTRGMGAMVGALLGSVAMKVLYRVDIPVQLVKHRVRVKTAPKSSTLVA